MTRRVASGVRSRGLRPVPPVVRISVAAFRWSTRSKRAAICVLVIGHKAGFDGGLRATALRSITTAGPAVSVARPCEHRSETVRRRGAWDDRFVAIYFSDRQHLDGVKPGFDALRPGGDRQLGAAQAVAVSALRVDMQLGWEPWRSSTEESSTVAFSTCTGSSSAWTMNVGGVFSVGLISGFGRHIFCSHGEVAGIDDDGEVGAATELVGGVDGIVEALFEVGAESGGEMRSGRKAEDADRGWDRCAIRGVLAHEAKGALRVLQGCGRFGIRAGVRDAIFHEHAGDADGVEPVADFGAFEIDGEDAIASAGKDNDGGAGVVLLAASRG